MIENKTLRTTNIFLTALGYIAYPLLLLLLYIFQPALLARCIAVPVAGFTIVSAFRYFYDSPRPYETERSSNGAYQMQEAQSGKKRGKSFPSRHVFSMFMIAFCWLVWIPPAGIFLLLCGCALAFIRVRAGLHFARDVIAGAAFAILCGAVGFYLIP